MSTSNITDGTITISTTNNVSASGSITGAELCMGSDCKSAWPTEAEASPWVSESGSISYSSGYVGIGTNAPTEKLEVAGNIKLSGNIVSDGDICIGQCD